jgi:hypothetical protein
MYSGLMVCAVSIQAAEVSNFPMHYRISTHPILLSRTDRRVQRRLTSASDSQVEVYEYRVKTAFYTAKREVLD